jgi:hypothetical protein
MTVIAGRGARASDAILPVLVPGRAQDASPGENPGDITRRGIERIISG